MEQEYSLRGGGFYKSNVISVSLAGRWMVGDFRGKMVGFRIVRL